MDVVNTMNRIISFVDSEKRAEMLDDPEIQAVYDAAGVPIPRQEVEETPWAGTSLMDRAKAAVTPWATEMEKERGTLRPGGIISPPTRQVRPPTPRSTILPAAAEGALPEGVTEEDIQFTMKKHKLTRQQVLARMK